VTLEQEETKGGELEALVKEEAALVHLAQLDLSRGHAPLELRTYSLSLIRRVLHQRRRRLVTFFSKPFFTHNFLYIV
jgi:hypothetical protein